MGCFTPILPIHLPSYSFISYLHYHFIFLVFYVMFSCLSLSLLSPGSVYLFLFPSFRYDVVSPFTCYPLHLFSLLFIVACLVWLFCTLSSISFIFPLSFLCAFFCPTFLPILFIGFSSEKSSLSFSPSLHPLLPPLQVSQFSFPPTIIESNLDHLARWAHVNVWFRQTNASVDIWEQRLYVTFTGGGLYPGMQLH